MHATGKYGISIVRMYFHACYWVALGATFRNCLAFITQVQVCSQQLWYSVYKVTIGYHVLLDRANVPVPKSTSARALALHARSTIQGIIYVAFVV